MQKYEKIIDNSYECPIFFRHLVPDTPLRGFACSGPFPGLFSGFAGGGIRSMQLKNKKCGLENRNYSISDTAGGLFCTEKGVCCLAVANPSG